MPFERVSNILESASISNLVIERKNKNIKAENVISFEYIENCNPPASTKIQYFNDATAYVIYTSGSTGKPKGVEIGMNSLTNFLEGILGAIPLTSKDRLLSITTLSFDISIMELFAPLIVGATVILGNHRIQIDMALLKSTIINRHVTTMQATPITWELLISSGWKNKTRITILCGGDKISRKLSSKLFDLSDSFFCLYGPTETTIWASVLKVENKASVSLGKPLPNIKFYILDDNYNQSSKGELYIEGKCLAKGYYKNKTLTERSFIRLNKFGRKRLYKTGDIVEKIKNQIFFVGRADQQVKINGFRVELGEIENVAEAIPEIKHAVAALDKETKALYLFVISNNKIQKEKVLARLKQVLPSYMLPSRIIEVKKYALTFNNKVDRNKTLYSYLANHCDRGINESELKTVSILKKVKDAWKEVLKTESVDINTTYDELGMNSIDIVEICTILSEAGYSIGITDFLKLKTISNISSYINKTVIKTPEEKNYCKYNLVPKTDKMFYLSPLQEKMLFDFYVNSGNRSYIENYTVILKKNSKSVSNILKIIQKQISVTPILHTKFYLKKIGPSVGVFSPTINNFKIMIKDFSQDNIDRAKKLKELDIHDINKQSMNVCVCYDREQILIKFSFHHIRLDMFSFYGFLYEILKQIDKKSDKSIKAKKPDKCYKNRDYFLQQGFNIKVDNFGEICRFCQNKKIRISNFFQVMILREIAQKMNSKEVLEFGEVYKTWNNNQFKLGNNIEVKNYKIDSKKLYASDFQAVLDASEIIDGHNDLLFTFNYLDKEKQDLDKLFTGESLQIKYQGQSGYKNNIVINIFDNQANIIFNGKSPLIKQVLININNAITKYLKERTL